MLITDCWDLWHCIKADAFCCLSLNESITNVDGLQSDLSICGTLNIRLFSQISGCDLYNVAALMKERKPIMEPGRTPAPLWNDRSLGISAAFSMQIRDYFNTYPTICALHKNYICTDL